jgi:histidine phosphotransferase ChpT
MTEDLYITALVTARMCHDLASPIGAIGNGIKLVEITGIKLGQ